MTSALLPNYARAPLAFERGEGAWLFTRDGQRYLDFGAGVAVNALGHAHPHLVAALQEQAAKVWHVSNLYQIPEGERLGRRFVEATFAEVAFFCNSGAEANEAAIKIARKYHAAGGHPERYRIVTFEGAFHGRTLATLAAGGQQKYIDGFGPKVEGFDQVPTGDFAALEKAIGPETAALMIEPVQGEGGVRVIPPADLRRLRDLCDEHGLLLIMDEVQTGMGRTGKLFAYEWSGIAPDILSAAKGIGGGFPLGACLTTKEAARGMVAGSHGSTFGGNPLAMAVGNAVLDVILSDGFLDRVAHTGLVLKQKLAALRDKHPRVIQDVRGEGLMVGLKLGVPNTEFAAAAREANLLVIPAGDNVVRLIPPLIVTESDVEEAVRRLDAAANGFSALRGAAE